MHQLATERRDRLVVGPLEVPAEGVGDLQQQRRTGLGVARGEVGARVGKGDDHGVIEGTEGGGVGAVLERGQLAQHRPLPHLAHHGVGTQLGIAAEDGQAAAADEVDPVGAVALLEQDLAGRKGEPLGVLREQAQPRLGEEVGGVLGGGVLGGGVLGGGGRWHQHRIPAFGCAPRS